MGIARRHLPVIQCILDSSLQYARVRGGVTTGAGGALLLIGEVNALAALAELRMRVTATSSPVRVCWAVRVKGE